MTFLPVRGWQPSVIAQNSDGSYSALGTVQGGQEITDVAIRVQTAGTVLDVAVDGQAIPGTRQADTAAGWFSADVRPLEFGSLPWFADLHVHLPAGRRGEHGDAVTVAVTSPSFRTDVADPAPLPVKLLPTPFPTFPPPRSATDVFHDNGDNTKEDNRMTGGVVSKGVVLAGWLMDGMPEANHGVGTRDDETEDYHYDILLDSDFITRTYGSPPLQPLTNAMIPGQSVPLIHIPAPTPVPLVYGPRATSDDFTLPASGVMTVELNSWHKTDRPGRPAGWAEDPDPDLQGNLWAFPPRRPLGVDPGEPELAPNDYLIISGTLWEDTQHGDDEGKARRDCWNGNGFFGHAGWLEVHPVDSIRRIDPPPQHRKHSGILTACDPGVPTYDGFVRPWGRPPDDAVLRYEVIADPRFSTGSFTHNEIVDPACPTRLHVTGSAGSHSTFKATVLLWWENTGTPQPRPICSDNGVLRQPLTDDRRPDD